MSFKDQLETDLAVFFNTDEYAVDVTYHHSGVTTTVTVQFFDDESDMGDSMMRKLIAKVTDVPTISKSGYFLINGDKYGVIDFKPDEQGLIMQILLQKGM